MPRYKKRERRENVWAQQLEQKDYTNARLEEYYKEVFPWSAGEWHAFMLALRSPLPSCIRLSVTEPSHVSRIRALFSDAIASGEGAIRVVPIFEGSDKVIAWDVEIARRKLKRHVGLASFHQSLVMETNMGTVSRQEAVSMLPVCFLDVQPHHTVLDMCAAPGSKTAQIIEVMANHSTGVVIANDVDLKRLSVLIKQCQRLRGVAPHLLVTHCCATSYPTSVGRFDRILCDVMCSGDGTLRKSPDLWVRWKPNDAANMHRQQVRVVARAFRLLKPGGRLVYSTCSMNPLEDEATVAACVLASEGQMEIIDAAEVLPNLKYSRGMPSWRLFTNDGVWYNAFEDVPAQVVGRFNITDSMFPPKGVDLVAMGITKTIRVLPHQQNTGGFYIAILQKKGGDVSSTLPLEIKSDSKEFNVYSAVDPAILKQIQSFWDVRPDFPFHLLFQRTESKKQTKIYLTCADALQFLNANPQRVNIQHVGVRLWEMSKRAGEPVRLAQEGCAQVAPFLAEGIVRFTLPPDVFLAFLQNPSATRVEVVDAATSKVFVLQCTTTCGITLCISVHKSANHAGFSMDIEDVEKKWMLARLGVMPVVVAVGEEEEDEEAEEPAEETRGDA